jgi:hypothetical protein
MYECMYVLKKNLGTFSWESNSVKRIIFALFCTQPLSSSKSQRTVVLVGLNRDISRITGALELSKHKCGE